MQVLEFARVLELVAAFASSGPGAARVRSVVPVSGLPAVAAEHERVEAMRGVFTSEQGWQAHPIPDLGAALERLRIPGTAWTGLELRAAHALLVSSRLTHRSLSDKSRDEATVSPLAEIASRLVRDPDTEKAIDRVVADDGAVRDDASPALRKLRKERRHAEADLVRMLERLMAKLEAHHRVDDASVTLRNGRYVIPVRREGRGAIGGIVHDTSGSGGTLFVEPPAAIDAGNRMRELEAEELRETERILLEATDRLRPQRDALVATLGALTRLDALAACARYAIAHQCAPVSFAAPGVGLTIVNGRHPLLLAQDPATVVPFDLTMGPDEHTLLVSGPNTGGKTVLLKAVALVSLMAQAGIPAPVGVGSRLPVFDTFYADIGDEQSIAASLSTFSAHVKNLTEIVREATGRSLVLVDELGSGTDPAEGAALGGAVLETLTRRGTTTIASTHLGALKELAHEVDGVTNASLQFDAVALAPTFRLVQGVPGRSYGLSIARRLAMPEDILRNAEGRMPKGERDVTALLEDLERRQQRVAEREGAAAARDEGAERRNKRLLERERRVTDQERELERSAREAARKYLLDARQAIDETIRQLKAAGAEQIEALGAAARRATEQRAAAEAEALMRLDLERSTAAQGSPEDGGAVREVRLGDAVAVSTLGGKAGRVVGRRGDDAVVAVGAMKLTVPITSLRRLSDGAAGTRETAVPLIGDQPEIEVRQEVDLRGMRVGEMDDVLVHALDAAVRADLHALRIIHGKGTGALRERVAALLKEDPRVVGFRLGAWNEGGAGVTVVELA
ncbi:MAG: endonuclease MutS2 [Gemmatimonadales bacterium]